MYKSKRHRLECTRSELLNIRSTHDPMYKELGEFILPNRTRFLLNDTNRGGKRTSSIIDSTASYAVTVLQAGMMSGITSPSRDWKRLTTPDPDLAEFQKVKEWLDFVNRTMSTTFLRSNLYQTLPPMYGDLSTFATAPIIVEEDFDNVIHTMGFPIGSYTIAADSKGRVRVFHRDFRLTVRQTVEKFGQYDEKTGRPKWEAFSMRVKDAYDNSRYDETVDIAYALEPNPDYRPGSDNKKFAKYAASYWERGASGPDANKFLRESGYDYFPVLCPRWLVLGEDAYGTDSCGYRVIDDVKQLQFGEKIGLQGIEQNARPTWKVPTSLRGQNAQFIPGGVVYTDEPDKITAAREINPRLVELEQKQQQVRSRIDQGYFKDIFLMIANDSRAQRATAAEIVEGKEEKFLMLGPTLQQVDKDLLDPLIDITFDILVRQGKIPPAPEELQGVPLKVEYISLMAQAQKLVAIGGYERFAQTVGMVAQHKPAVLDKFNADQYVDEVGEALGVSPKIIVSDEEVAKVRQAQAQAQAAQAQVEMANQGAQAAKNLSQANLEGDNALSAILGSGGTA